MEEQKMIEVLEQQTRCLAYLAKQLDQLIAFAAPVSPDYRAALHEYKAFDWQSIGAQVLQSDAHGAVAVRWHRHDFVRRSGDGKFGRAIWFSRCVGKRDGENEYARLITFKGNNQYDAEPVPFNV